MLVSLVRCYSLFLIPPLFAPHTPPTQNHANPALEGRKPASMYVKFPLGKERRKAFRTIRKHLGGTNYRQDLIKVCD